MQMKSMSRGPALAVAALLVACGAPQKPLPPYMQSAVSDHPKFPRNRFIVEVGISTLSADDADLRAKRQVSERISADLRAQTSSYMEARSRNGVSHEQQRMTEQIVVRTGFERADLIGIVERERSGDSFYSVAVLDRVRTDEEMGKAKHGEIVQYKSYAETALSAWDARNMSEFWAALGKAAAVRPAVDASWIQRRAVLGRPSADEAAWVSLSDDLLKKAAVALSKQLVLIRLEGAVEAADLLKLTNAAVQRMKLRVGDAKTCAAVGGDAQAYAAELVLQPEENCSEGSLGERCEVGVQLRAASCAGGAEGRGSIAPGRGVHPSDRARARKAAWTRVLTEQAVETAVKQALQGAIAAGCPNAGC